MEVHDDACAGRPRGRQCAPAEGGIDVVGVHDARARPANGGRDLLGRQSAAQHPGGRAPAAEHGRVALQQLDVLAEALARQPQEVRDGALLAAGGAVAVVQDEDHGSAEAGAGRLT